jgi:hypothetical protein
MSNIDWVSGSPLVPVSWGELFDKICILQIKIEHIVDPAALSNVTRELAALMAARDRALGIPGSDLDTLVKELRAINSQLWSIEDDIRAKEARREFDRSFIDLARSVYRVNDERGRVKRAINTLLNSQLVEEKLYYAY